MAKKRRKPHHRPRSPQAGSGSTATATRPPATQADRSTSPQTGERTAPRPAQATHHRTERKQLAKAERDAARKRIARKARMRRIAWAGGIGVVVAGAALFLNSQASTTRPDELPGELTTEAPWDANGNEAEERAEAIGLPPESPVVMHEHTNLQIFVHGERIAIPTEIGIDRSGSQPYVASLHTHEDSGTVHVESSVSRTFTLGEFFDIWGVRLTPSCMGGYCNDATNQLRVFVEGQDPPDGIDIREVALTDQQVVVIAFGTEDEIPDPIPTEFDFGSVPQ